MSLRANAAFRLMLLGIFTCSIRAPVPLSVSLFSTHSQLSSGVDVQETKIQMEQLREG